MFGFRRPLHEIAGAGDGCVGMQRFPPMVTGMQSCRKDHASRRGVESENGIPLNNSWLSLNVMASFAAEEITVFPAKTNPG